MLKKIIIGILSISVASAGGAAVAYNVASLEPQPSSTISPIVTPQTFPAEEQTNPIMAAEGSLGEPWQAAGLIESLDDQGLYLAIPESETVYVELGPPEFWQNQGVLLVTGLQVTVIGTINNEGMIHASQVVLADGQTLTVRTEEGQPLWSGGASSQSQNSEQLDASGTPQPQAQVDDWITITGTLISFQGGNMTMATSEGEVIAFQSGQPRFFADQGVTFRVGDEISVVGYYENDQFKAGDITQLSTGLRVLLRDPNGRPLWAGPGSGSGGNGKGGGNK